MSQLPILFPLAEYWWFYLAFVAFVIGLLSLDLGVFHRTAHTVSFKEATIWSIVWVSLALTFNVFFYYFSLNSFSDSVRLMSIPGFDPQAEAWRVSLEFLTGYVVEKSLSVDNIFVFVVVFTYFQIPAQYQHRVLFFGILGALIFRAIFIALGAVLMQYHAIVFLMGAFLIFTGVKMMFSGDEQVHPESNPVIKILKKIMPITPRLEGQKFFVRKEGVLFATPLFVALMVLEATDIVFAIDSVPAIFAITREPLIVFTSNMFAILGLRAMYFLLAGAVDKFHFLKYGLSIVLVFVGLKMTVFSWLLDGQKFPIGWSLGIIAGTIGGSIFLSLVFPKKHEEEAENKAD